MPLSRLESLFGKEMLCRLKQSRILILGVGGVGGYALDCLYRSGVEHITIVDYDSFEPSNQNRQIGSEAVGVLKTEHLKSLYPNISTITQRMDLSWVEQFDFDPYDVVIDAADTTRVKIALALKIPQKLIMALGSAKRFDSSAIKVCDIFETHNNRLARKIRYELKRAKFDKKLKVIFSSEIERCEEMGSCVAVTGAFGLFACSEAIKMITTKSC